MREESFKAENVDEIVRLRLNRLKSPKLCEGLLNKKIEKEGVKIAKDLLENKARGLASAVESALGYWNENPVSLNSRVLSRYYFLLQMTIAEQVGKVSNTDDLSSVQRHTEHGHGLKTIRNPQTNFPDDFYVFALMGGHFYAYMKSIGLQPKNFALEGSKSRKYVDIEQHEHLISLIDLFRRIPELQNVIEEYCGKPPLCFNVGYSDKSKEMDSEKTANHIMKTGKFPIAPPSTTGNNTSFISVYNPSKKITPEYLNTLSLPITNFEYCKDFQDKNELVGRLEHDTKYWHQSLNLYNSGYAPSSLITPVWGTVDDPIVINFSLLYALSIIVRYMPDLWYRITSGNLNQYGSLIEYYVSVMDHVLPHIMLERVTESKIAVHQPGSLFGPL